MNLSDTFLKNVILFLLSFFLFPFFGGRGGGGERRVCDNKDNIFLKRIKAF